VAATAEDAGLVVEMREVASLRPHERNYNRHSTEQVHLLAKSLQTHGQTKNLVILADGTILAGHGLWQAAQLNGWKRIACGVYTGSNPEAYLVADNYLAQLAEPDDTMLASLLQDLQAQGDLDATGFSDDDLGSLLAGLQAGNPAGVTFPEFDENLPDSDAKAKTATCPECGHVFTV